MDEAQLGLFYVLTVSWGEIPDSRLIDSLGIRKVKKVAYLAE